MTVDQGRESITHFCRFDDVTENDKSSEDDIAVTAAIMGCVLSVRSDLQMHDSSVTCSIFSQRGEESL